MNDQMKFPATFEKFAKEYGFKDDKEVYTNGSDLIPIFRVKQWLEHDNKLRKIEADTAYECGKHATADKIRAEIEQAIRKETVMDSFGGEYERIVSTIDPDDVLEILDKYKPEREE